LASTRPGDLVLDPFVGSGTTVLAALRVAWRCIGLDQEPFLIWVRQE
jgi:DNA modification methylase